MKSSQHTTRFGTTDVLLVLVTTIWGLNYVISKISLQEMNPMVFNSLRFVIGAVICWIILLFRETNFKVSKGELFHLFIMGIVAHGINQVAFVYGVAKTSASTASLILAATPMCVAFLAGLLKLEKANGKTIMGIVISFGGVALVVMGAAGGIGINVESDVGNMLIVIATLFWSLYTIMIRLYFKDISIVKVTTYSMTITAVFFSMISLKQIMAADWFSYSGAAWTGVIYSGIFVFGISYTLWNIGVRKVGPTRTSVYANLPPFVSILTGRLILGEMITKTQILGGLLIIFGLIYANQKDSVKQVEKG
ncbi:DMT family transporter [Anaerosolibacter sp.]|uniref:DMT family transporter n=1 Tax=Anaerosolibacter sp. TaxID=1872527 RepID=UPI0039EEE9E4